MKFLAALSTMSIVVVVVTGHGRLTGPPGRGTAWRYGFKTPPDYTDHGANCGGLSTQTSNGGKCGICGDNYRSKTPRPHELGGKWGQGVIVKTYKEGQVITSTVQLTANHKGYFKFDYCSLGGQTKDTTTESTEGCSKTIKSTAGSDRKNETEECFKPLKFACGRDQQNVDPKKNFYTMKLQLPKGVTCKHCVFRWTYVAGNNWGVVPQETFKNCADISIQ